MGMAINEDIIKKLNFLDLKYLHENWNKLLNEAQQENPSFHKFLENLLTQEYHLKKETLRQSKIKRSNIKDPWVIETFPFDRQPNLKKKYVMDLIDTLDYVKYPKDIILLGPTGCGKTGLGTSFLIQALNNGYTGYFIEFKDLLSKLYQAVADHTEKRVLKRFGSYDILLIDEMGYSPIERAQAGLFFDLMRGRHKKMTTIITTQLGFIEWGSFLNNPHLTAALVDRLTENCTVFNMKTCISLRKKDITYATEE
jgi:DNA replication protein DnaC